MIRVIADDVRLSSKSIDEFVKVDDDLKPHYCLSITIDFEEFMDFRAMNGKAALERRLGAELIQAIEDRKAKIEAAVG